MFFKLRYHILIFIFLIGLKNPALTQNFNDYSTATDIFYKNYSLINPASSGTYAPFEIYMDSKNLTGIFSKVHTFYTGVNYRIAKNKSGENKHVLGGLFFGDKEGEFFGKSRLYLTYSYHIAIKNDFYLAAGIAPGFASYSYKSSTASPGGSDNAFTGNIGLWFYNPFMHIGISSLDMMNSKIRPIDETRILSRFYVFTFDRKFSLSPQFSVMPVFEGTWHGNKYARANFGGVALLQNFSAAVLYQTSKAIAFSIGIEELRLLNNNLNLFFAYKMALGNSTQLAINSFELGFNYFIKEKISKEDEFYNLRKKRKSHFSSR